MSLAKGIFATVAKQYQKIVAGRCATMGLKYEDLLIESNDVEHALNRIPKDVLLEREQRIKRAFDASAKRKEIHPSNRPKEVYDLYLADAADEAQKDREERAILNSY